MPNMTTALSIGFVQLNGATYPAMTNNQVDRFGVTYATLDIDGRLAVAWGLPMYRLSRYDFYKWFPNAAFSWLIEWCGDIPYFRTWYYSNGKLVDMSLSELPFQSSLEFKTTLHIPIEQFDFGRSPVAEADDIYATTLVAYDAKTDRYYFTDDPIKRLVGLLLGRELENEKHILAVSWLYTMERDTITS